MADLFRRNRREPDGGDDAPSTPEVDGDDGTTTDRIQRYAAVSSEPAAESAHAASRAQPERPPAANVGTHVNQVLEAAEKAARDLVEQAEREAARRRAAAEADVVALRAAATAEADEAREQAVSVRTEAEREADERRRSADEYAAARRSEADSEAEQVVAAARSEAAELGRAEAERHRVLQENVEVAETRLRELVGGLRGIADRLEVLVDGNAATRSPDSEREDELAESLIAQAATPRRATRGGRDRT